MAYIFWPVVSVVPLKISFPPHSYPRFNQESRDTFSCRFSFLSCGLSLSPSAVICLYGIVIFDEEGQLFCGMFPSLGLFDASS